MLYWLTEFSPELPIFNIFRYITFRTGGAVLTALLFVFLFGPRIIKSLRIRQGKGQPIRKEGPERHLLQKQVIPPTPSAAPLCRRGTVEPAPGKAARIDRPGMCI